VILTTGEGAVPAVGQVEVRVAAAVPGDAGGDGDQVGPDGGAFGLGVAGGGEDAGHAGQVVRDGGQDEPGGVRGEDALADMRSPGCGGPGRW